MPHRHVLVIVLAVAAATSAVALVFAPFAQPLFFHLDSARELLATGRTTDHHAVGYALLLALGLTLGGLAGVLVLHVAIFLAAAAAAVDLLRALGAAPRARVAGGLIVALHPLLVVNVTKISDTNLSVLLLLLVARLLVAVRGRGLAWPVAGAATALFAAVLLVRPNMLVLFPLVWLLAARHTSRQAAIRWALATAAAILIALAVNARVTGAWRLTDPYYAAYTFHNGNNPRAADHILRETIGEYSTYRSLEDEGIDYVETSKADLAPILWRLSTTWIREHPHDYLRLLGVKTLNFFRPYYRRGAAAWPAAVVQTVAALPVLVWAWLRWKSRRRLRWHDGLLGLVILPLFALPFILTNVEPRYRWPVDVLLLLEAVWMAAGTPLPPD